MRFVIIGAGEVGLCLCHYLLGGDEEVILIERNEALVKKLSERITARLICGDSTLFSTLRQIDLPQVDAVLAMTQDDASNILSCTLAKNLALKKRSAASITSGTMTRNCLITKHIFSSTISLTPNTYVHLKLQIHPQLT